MDYEDVVADCFEYFVVVGVVWIDNIFDCYKFGSIWCIVNLSSSDVLSSLTSPA